MREKLLAVVIVSAFAGHANSQIISEDYRFVTTPLSHWVVGFGIDVAVDAGVAAITATNDLRLGHDFGGVVYLFDTETGAQKMRIARHETEDHDAFGQYLDMAEGYLAVGAPGEDDGAVYLYHTISGAELRRITPPQPVIVGRFGQSVAIHDALIAIGAGSSGLPGAVFLYEMISGNLLETYTSQNSHPSGFGVAVDMYDSTVVVGAASETNSEGVWCGAVYIYDTNKPGSEIRITPYDPGSFDLYGISVATNGEIVAVGCSRDDSLGENSGAVYVYEAATGEFVVKLKSADRNIDGWFGVNLAIEGNALLVGASANDGSSPRSGAAYLFDIRTWEQTGKLEPSGGSGLTIENFGSAVALSGNRAVVGAYRTFDVDVGRTGSAHSFVLPNLSCPADVNGDGVLSAADFSAWIAAFNAGATECDQNADGTCTPTDFTAWIANYNQGC